MLQDTWTHKRRLLNGTRWLPNDLVRYCLMVLMPADNWIKLKGWILLLLGTFVNPYKNVETGNGGCAQPVLRQVRLLQSAFYLGQPEMMIWAQAGNAIFSLCIIMTWIWHLWRVSDCENRTQNNDGWQTWCQSCVLWAMYVVSKLL